MSIQVLSYQNDDKRIWNKFVRNAKNATFMFDRNFMDYHAEQFSDFSVLVFDNQRLRAVLPANRSEDILFSHQGLSYGGLLLPKDVHLREVLHYFEAILDFYKKKGIKKIIYKKIPAIYHQELSFEDDYALFLAHAKLLKKEVNSVIELHKELSISQLRTRSIRKALINRLEVRESQDLEVFWEKILSPNLWERHQKIPVHSLAQIQFLANRFPENIKLYLCFQKEEALAGVVLFENHQTVHCQYIGNSEQGRELGASDLLFYELLSVYYTDYQYFSFGISTENDGQILNKGLHYWKESWGAKTFMHDFYEIELENTKSDLS